MSIPTTTQHGINSDKPSFLLITGNSLEQYRDTIIELLQDGEAYWSEHYSLNDILLGIAQGQGQFWLYEDPVKGPILGMLSRISVTPKLKSVVVLWMGGKELPPREHFPAITAMFEYFARKFECSKIECKARPGLERIFEGLGFEKTAVYLEHTVEQIVRH